MILIWSLPLYSFSSSDMTPWSNVLEFSALLDFPLTPLPSVFWICFHPCSSILLGCADWVNTLLSESALQCFYFNLSSPANRMPPNWFSGVKADFHINHKKSVIYIQFLEYIFIVVFLVYFRILHNIPNDLLNGNWVCTCHCIRFLVQSKMKAIILITM